ncbi:hypothetical protein DMUE_1852 [Dictyocoela muelleri]|nr:hypothetical protein DMUE_1852 [Dictyocoela muelleri]
MHFKNRSFISCLAASGVNQEKTNQRGKPSSKLAKEKQQAQLYKSPRDQDDFTVRPQNDGSRFRLYKGMETKEAEIQIYIICRSRVFEELAPNHQFLQIVEQADGFIQRWYYEKGSSNKLPLCLENFFRDLKAFI